jgi:hypothetical protein
MRRIFWLAAGVLAVWAAVEAAALAGPAPAAGPGGDQMISTVIDGVDISLWMPAGVAPVRGCLVKPADAKVGGGGYWTEALRAWRFAELGMMLRDEKRNNRPTILLKAMLAAFDEFAAKTGRAELRNAPLCFTGLSKGGGWSRDLAMKLPERTIAYANVCGWVADPNAGEAALAVPGLFIMGETDEFKQLPTIESQFEPGRAKGARWTVAVQWATGHDWRDAGKFILPYFDREIHDRLPAGKTAVDEPVALRPESEELGWLGDRATWGDPLPLIAPWPRYRGDRAKAVWLPDAYVARLWRAFMTKDPLLTLAAAPAKDVVEGKRAGELLVRAGGEITLEATMKEGVKAVKVDFYDGDLLLGWSMAPYRYTWKDVPAGAHGIIGIAALEGGGQASSKILLVVGGKL